jgi:cell division GTPase FtsZ
MSTRLRFAVVGLGQCGGNLANTFARFNYPSLAINTSILDLKDLEHVPENRKIHIPLPESDGAGKDPRIGEKAIFSHASEIVSAMQQFAQGADAILLVAGLGGGTGSNVAVLGNLLKRLNLPIMTLVTIPTDNESALAKINALRAVNRIVSENFDSCILIDNAKILRVFPDSSLAGFYPQANEYVVQTFANFNSLSQEFASRCLISFDNEDFRKVLLSKGILIFGESELSTDEIRTLDDLLPRLKTIWETSGLMAEGFNFTTAAAGAVCIFAPQDVLQRTSSRFLNQLSEEFKSLTNGATCYFGIYEHGNAGVVKVATMLGRLTIPERLQELLGNATFKSRFVVGVQFTPRPTRKRA